MNKPANITVNACSAIPYSEESALNFLPLDCLIQIGNLTCLVGPHRTQLRSYLQMLAGISIPEYGQVEIFGQQISVPDQSAWLTLRSKIGYVSGTAPLLSVHHGLMNVMIPALYHGNLSYSQAEEQARALLKELNCQFDPLTFPAFLDSFQCLQLALARALILDPELLILDVPFHDLGALHREQMSELLGNWCQKRAVCMIGGLQHIHFLEEYATQIIFISERKIIHFKSWEKLMQTKDQDIEDLLGISHSSARVINEY